MTLRFTLFMLLGLTCFGALHPNQAKAEQFYSDRFKSDQFKKVSPLLCPGKACTLDEFKVVKQQLTDDGWPEWMFYGPISACDSNNNCPLKILQSQKKGFQLLNQNCQGEGCMISGNPKGSKDLFTFKNGYHDLLISKDNGSGFWTKAVYQWDGQNYRFLPNSTLYFLYDSNTDHWVQVTQEKYQSCQLSGLNCFKGGQIP